MQRKSEVNETEILKTMRDASIQSVAIASGSSKDDITTTPLPKKELSGDKDASKQEIFGAASLSKPVFAYLVLKLINDTDFKLDTKLQDILPFGDYCTKVGWDNSEENRKHAKLFTPAMILSHQTGLPIGYNPGPDPEHPAPLIFDFDPREEKFAYSGLHLMYLQECIKIKFGKDLEQLAKEFVFIPAGLSTNTTFNSPKGQNAANSLHTTAEDYAKFCLHWMNDPDPRVQEAFTSKVSLRDDLWAIREDVPTSTLDHLNWGYGWGLEITDTGKRIAFHTGDMNEWNSGVQLDLDTKSVRVFFSKSDSANGHVLRDQIFGKSYASDYFFDKFQFARTVDELQDDWRINPHYGLRKTSIIHSSNNTMSSTSSILAAMSSNPQEAARSQLQSPPVTSGKTPGEKSASLSTDSPEAASSTQDEEHKGYESPNPLRTKPSPKGTINQ